jgi:REP element-mobilizing transposase RayT
MAQSLSQLYTHVVFSTKDRTGFLRNKKLRGEMHAYLVGTCNNLGSPSLIVGGVADHVHLLVRLSKNIAVATFVRELKRESSKWIKDKGPDLDKFHWQQGYGAFSISPGHKEDLTSYIATQEDHHTRETYQDEFRRLLGKYHIEYDEKYVWD